MKTLMLLLSAAFMALGLSSCTLDRSPRFFAGSYYETYQARAGYDVIREEHVVDAKSGLVEVTETKVPRYVEKKRKIFVKCQACHRFYTLDKGCCGSDTTQARKMATAQGPTGSPHIGLVPTMKNIVP